MVSGTGIGSFRGSFRSKQGSIRSKQGSIRSKQGSIRSTHSVYDQSPATCDRVKSNAESSFPQPTLECPDMVADLDNEKGIEIRTKHLVGKTVKGVLMRRRGGYFIKWNEELSDAVFVTEECVERDIGGKKQKGLVAVVKCTIEKLGPSYAPWHKQHPLASKVELVERYWNSYHKRRQSELQTPKPGSRAIIRKTASAKGYRPNRPNMAPRAESFRVRRGTAGSVDVLSVPAQPTGYVPPKRRGQRRCRPTSVRTVDAPSDRNGSGKLVWRPRCLSQQVAKRGESSRFFRAS